MPLRLYDGGKPRVTSGPQAGTPRREDAAGPLAIGVWEPAYALDERNRRPHYAGDEPVKRRAWKGGTMHLYGIPGLIILALDIWALVSVLQSGLTPGAKLLWVLVIVLLPVLGVILWFLLGARRQAG